jgi:hypothetical protein
MVDTLATAATIGIRPPIIVASSRFSACQICIMRSNVRFYLSCINAKERKEFVAKLCEQ